jgi:L-alanine-DL-glutamate epimerase-like enolase superfamily enzyme
VSNLPRPDKRGNVTAPDSRVGSRRSAAAAASARKLSVRAEIERWPIAGTFVISRERRTEAKVVVTTVSDGIHAGRSECVPYARYGESIESVVAAIEAAELDGTDREFLRRMMPAGAARNALDGALWDFEAKASGVTVAVRLGIQPLRPLLTAYTISLGTPATMAESAREAVGRPLLKLKLGGDGDAERIAAVRASVPTARLIADANEAWSERNLSENMRACAEAGVELVEQPLPADNDAMLLDLPRSVPLCADESVHVIADLDALKRKYEAVNVKLDKAGGLTEALDLVQEARRRGFRVMVGCMVGTSLAMAPAVLLAQTADWVDLDGPLLLARDRDPGLAYSGAVVAPPNPILWG